MLGIIIGISSVITLVAIGKGAQGSIQATIQSLGSNLLVVIPGAQTRSGYQRLGRPRHGADAHSGTMRRPSPTSVANVGAVCARSYPAATR